MVQMVLHLLASKMLILLACAIQGIHLEYWTRQQLIWDVTAAMCHLTTCPRPTWTQEHPPWTGRRPASTTLTPQGLCPEPQKPEIKNLEPPNHTPSHLPPAPVVPKPYPHSIKDSGQTPGLDPTPASRPYPQPNPNPNFGLTFCFQIGWLFRFSSNQLILPGSDFGQLLAFPNPVSFSCRTFDSQLIQCSSEHPKFIVSICKQINFSHLLNLFHSPALLKLDR